MQGKLNAESRSLSKQSSFLNRARKNGQVPAIIYGKGMDSKPVFVNPIEVTKVLNKYGQVMDVSVDGQTYLANLDTIQRDPVSHKVVHISFHKLDRNQKTIVNLPIYFEGTAAGIKEGGVVVHNISHVDIEGLPGDIPEAIHANLDSLTLNSTIHVSDLEAPKGCQFLAKDLENVIASCSPMRAEKESVAEEAPSLEEEIRPVGEEDSAEEKAS